jgi:hypothetical protein
MARRAKHAAIHGHRSASVVVAALLAGLLTGCTTIPTTGSPQPGNDLIDNDGDIGFFAPEPSPGAGPDDIVSGFLQALQTGPTSESPFADARQYLVPQTAEQWQPGEEVHITSGEPVVSLDGTLPTDATSADVTVTYTVVASVDQHGIYAEESTATQRTAAYRLDKVDGQWRIATLPNGTIVPSALFSQNFHVTTLYFPSLDQSTWLPDVRWFPERTWRTNAVEELLAGPASYLSRSVSQVLPTGTSLALSAVVPAEDGSIRVLLSGQIDAVSERARGIFLSQVRESLAQGQPEFTVTLANPANDIISARYVQLDMPRTDGDAMVLLGGLLWTVDDRTLVRAELPLSLAGLTPTAMAFRPAAAFNEPADVIVRDGPARLVRLTDGEPEEIVPPNTPLLAPSLDPFGTVWTGALSGPLLVIPPGGAASPLEPAWLVGRSVTSVRVSPEGMRVALVSAGPGGPLVQVAGIVRDARGIPTALSAPVTVGASVAGVTDAVWQDVTTLALRAQDDGAGSVIFLAGIGGRAESQDGLPLRVTGVVNPVSVSAAVGSGEILALDPEGVLHLRLATASWTEVGSLIDLAVVPG